MQIPFEKYEQGGNDFVIIDATVLSCVPEDLTAWSRFLCNRHKGVGADGVLLLFPSLVADYRVRIFNADGSEPALCGNGVSCLLSSFFSRNPTKEKCTLELMHIVVEGKKIAKEILWSLGKVQVVHFPVELENFGTWYVVNTGVPHAVSFVDTEMDVERVGRAIRQHPLFAPYGVNVNFARQKADCLEVRTYERGVEKETLSCGTGGAAVAFVANKLHKGKNTVWIANRLDFQSHPIEYQKQNFFSLVHDEVHMVARGRKVFVGVL